MRWRLLLTAASARLRRGRHSCVVAVQRRSGCRPWLLVVLPYARHSQDKAQCRRLGPVSVCSSRWRRRLSQRARVLEHRVVAVVLPSAGATTTAVCLHARAPGCGGCVLACNCCWMMSARYMVVRCMLSTAAVVARPTTACLLTAARPARSPARQRSGGCARVFEGRW